MPSPVGCLQCGFPLALHLHAPPPPACSPSLAGLWDLGFVQGLAVPLLSLGSCVCPVCPVACGVWRGPRVPGGEVNVVAVVGASGSGGGRPLLGWDGQNVRGQGLPRTGEALASTPLLQGPGRVQALD